MKAQALHYHEFIALHPNVRLFVFDVDHTVTRKSTGIRFALDGYKHGHVRTRTILSFPFRFFSYRMGFYGIDNIPEEFKDLRGWSKSDLEAWSHDLFKRVIRHDVFPGAEAFIRAVKADGRIVVLSSSSFDFLLQPLSDWLEADVLYASKVKYDDKGLCTGEIKGPANFSHGKIEGIHEEIQRRGIQAKDIAFFSDSINDLPLLEAIGVPVPVHADRKLRHAAWKRGWKTWVF